MRQSLFSLFVFGELFCLVFSTHAQNKYFLSLIYLFCGIAIPILAIKPHDRSASENNGIHGAYLFGFALLLALVLEHYASGLFEAIPIDYRQADMLPVIKTMCERFVSGENVYAIIPEIWNGMQPIYLPSLWMAFLPAVYFDFDLRWVGLTGIYLAFIMIAYNGFRHLLLFSRVQFALLILAIMMLCSAMLVLDGTLILYTQEGVVLFYYVLLTGSLITSRKDLLAISIALCLLSRYFLLPWIGAFVLMYLINGKYRELRRIVLISFLLILIILKVSGAMNNLGLFAGLPSLYTEAVLNNPAKYQPVVAENLGLAKFFNWTNLRWVTALSLALCTLSSVGLVMLQHIKKWRIDMNRVLLVALKLVTVFYVNFLIIPYPYLFYVSSFITLMLFCELYKESKKKTL